MTEWGIEEGEEGEAVSTGKIREEERKRWSKRTSQKEEKPEKKDTRDKKESSFLLSDRTQTIEPQDMWNSAGLHCEPVHFP